MFHSSIKQSTNYKNNATRISIARTILHELLHTYFLSKIDDDDFGIPVNIYELNFLWNAIQSEVYGNNPLQYQHEQMARRFIEPIRDALKEWDGAQESDQYYEDLAWGALINTNSFNYYYPVGTPERQRIINTNHAEDTNTTQGGIVPKGNSC